MDYNIKLSNGQILKGLIKSPGQNLRAVVILVHGLGEHIQRYNHWADYFIGEMVAFTGVDLPGHGRTDGKRGHVRSFSTLHEIIEVLIGECKKTFPGTPVFLYGHSLGGLIVLDYILKKNPSVKGVIVTSPAIRLGFEPDKSKVKLAGLVKYFLPSLSQPTLLPVDFLSHDREVIERYRKDPLVHGKVTVNLFHGFMNASKDTLRLASELKLPLLLIHGSDDKVCSPSGSMEFAEKAKSTELKIWDGGYHELHNEPFRKEVFDFIMNWINKKIGKK
jgi:alpha-beta hydrolase superfamily lysophospholipase